MCITQKKAFFQINETFATEVLATMQELKLDESRVNLSGGALALGHPVAASGARMAVHLVHQLRYTIPKFFDVGTSIQ